MSEAGLLPHQARHRARRARTDADRAVWLEMYAAALQAGATVIASGKDVTFGGTKCQLQSFAACVALRAVIDARKAGL